LSEKRTKAYFPEKLGFLFAPARTKVAHGGRGSAKSWSFARALLILGAQKKLRILCTREVQKSIRDSVHKLLTDQIQALDLGYFYTVLQSEIRGINETSFIFAGLADHTVESIKSYEGVDIVWVEEAQVVSKASWDILIPTIRSPNSEIWVSLNPMLDTDETWTRFIVNPPPGAVVAQVNYTDNPWFPEVLEAERIHCKQADPKNYANIWEGVPKAAVDGAIYGDEVIELQAENRITQVPYDPAFKVHVVFDLGWNDKMAIGLVQRHLSSLRVIEYIEDSHKTLDFYSSVLKDRRYNWGTLFLPHDGAQKDFKYGKSAEEILRALGWTVQIVPMAGIEQGIRIGRQTLKRTYFDKGKTERLIECLKRYRRGIPTTTGEPATPVHDEFSHGADMWRYLATSAERMTNEDVWGKPIKYTSQGIV
jgi:phage terminase large subunit